MFIFKIIKPRCSSASLNHRHISAGSGKLLGFFKSEKASEAKPEDSVIDIIDSQEENEFDFEENQMRIDAIRNKSRLRENHRNVLHGKLPYHNAESWVHQTLMYQRKIYGRFGAASNVDPRTCFWTPTELDEKAEYERVAFPFTVQEMIAENAKTKQEKKEVQQQREFMIYNNLKKLDQWKKDIIARREKKDTEARVAKERKDRLIEEVRRHFGYTIDPRDDRFKELLEKKEKEQRKALKESKRLEKDAKLVEKFASGKGGKGKKEVENVEKEKKDDDVDEEIDEPENKKK